MEKKQEDVERDFIEFRKEMEEEEPKKSEKKVLKNQIMEEIHKLTSKG
jgi:hypothetical protein